MEPVEEQAMKRLINYYGPDPIDGGGAGPVNNENRDPGYSRIGRNAMRDDLEEEDSEEERGEKINAGLTWRDWLSPRAQERVKTIEKVIAGVVTGSEVIKRVKGMSRKQKIAAGALLVAGAAGATYLAMRKNRRRWI